MYAAIIKKGKTSGKSIISIFSDFQKYKGVSRSSCPNTQEWIDAFEDYDGVFCVTITSGLSGSCNAASIAVREYLETYPQKKGYVIDSLSAGSEITLIVEKLSELISQGLGFDEIKEKIIEYKRRTHLIFCLESLRNLANNGRCNPAVAKFAGILGIRIVGKASLEGTLEITDKARGEEKALRTIFKNMIAGGYAGEKIRIHHCHNIQAAKKLEEMIKKEFRNAVVKIQETRALCSFYAEAGGLLVGYEGAVKA